MVAKIDWPGSGTYVVAVSGGVDSVVLLDLLSTYNLDGRYNLVVAHMNHGMRADAAKDANLVRELADHYGLSLYEESVDLGANASEEAARRVRYGFLRQVATKVEAKGIITAHHLDDRLETVIFNGLRGANRYGLAPLRTRGDLYRPLVNVHKSEIYNYALERKLHWREDDTNSDPRYSRNLIRQQLNNVAHTPQQELVEALHKLDVINDNLDWIFRHWLKRVSEWREGSLYLSAGFLSRLNQEVLKHFLYFVLREVDPSVSMSSTTITRLAELVEKGETGQMVTINKYLVMWREYELVVLGNPALYPAPAPVSLRMGRSVVYGRWKLKMGKAQEGAIAVSKGSYKVRQWQAGDRVYPMGMQGSKKLQDIFVDRKIAQRLRREWPVVINQSDKVVWVPGLVADRRFVLSKPTPESLYLAAEVIR